MRGKDGIFDTTRLLRNQPFGEWVNVFFDPSKISEAQILKLIKAKNCPRAQHITGEFILNPFIAAGDPIQLSFENDQDTTLSALQLPKNWKLIGLEIGSPLKKGTHTITITSSKSSKKGRHPIKLSFSDGSQIEDQVTLVRQIGKH